MNYPLPIPSMFLHALCAPVVGPTSLPRAYLSTSGCLVLLVCMAGPAVGQRTGLAGRDAISGELQRVSVSSTGVQGNGSSVRASLSSDGRFVAFQSQASNLVPLDTNAVSDVFVHDQVTGITERLSVDSAGFQGNGASYAPSISSYGRYVAFTSDASNLVALDTNGVWDVFVRDRLMGTTERVSVDSAGVQGNGLSWSLPFYASCHCISADGRHVAFSSRATNLVPMDTNGSFDVFVHDRVTETTVRVSVDSAGLEWPYDSYQPAISSDGLCVAFASNHPYDQNVFVHDRATGVTQIVSNVGGPAGAHYASDPALSSDGRYVTYWTHGSFAPLEVFVYDRVAATRELVSANAGLGSAISGDGRYVAFSANNFSGLVPLDRNRDYNYGPTPDIFVIDRATGIARIATRASPLVSGSVESNRESLGPELSSDGRHLAFWSHASNLVPDDTNGAADIFVGRLRQ